MKQPAVLDFTADGGAIIRIADVGEVSVVSDLQSETTGVVDPAVLHAVAIEFLYLILQVRFSPAKVRNCFGFIKCSSLIGC